MKRIGGGGAVCVTLVDGADTAGGPWQQTMTVWVCQGLTRKWRERRVPGEAVTAFNLIFNLKTLFGCRGGFCPHPHPPSYLPQPDE